MKWGCPKYTRESNNLKNFVKCDVGVREDQIKAVIIIFTLCKFFTPSLIGGFSMKSK